MLRPLLTALAVLALLAGVSACGRAASDQQRLTIGLAVSNQQQDFFNLIKDAVRERAGSQGVDVIVADAKDDPVWQIDQIQGFITQRVDAIVYLPAGATAASVPVDAARSAGIPVVTVDRNPPDAPGDSFLATDSVTAARTIGEHLIQVSGGQGRLGVLQGQLGTTPEIARNAGFTQALEKAPDIQVVAQQPADWEQQEAFDTAQDMLQANPGINMFFGRADAMALGAAQAVRARGGAPTTIIGFDGDYSGLEAVRDGTITATMCQQTKQLGRSAVDTAMKLIAGQPVPREQLLPAFLVTQDNAEEFIRNHP